MHLSKEKQRHRLLQRSDGPDKNWKFSTADIEQHESWAKYREAYEACLGATSNEDAPWYAVPADDRQNAHLIISEIILDALKSLCMTYPRSDRARQRELLALRKRLASRCSDAPGWATAATVEAALAGISIARAWPLPIFRPRAPVERFRAQGLRLLRA